MPIDLKLALAARRVAERREAFQLLPALLSAPLIACFVFLVLASKSDALESAVLIKGPLG